MSVQSPTSKAPYDPLRRSLSPVKETLERVKWSSADEVDDASHFRNAARNGYPTRPATSDLSSVGFGSCGQGRFSMPAGGAGSVAAKPLSSQDLRHSIGFGPVGPGSLYQGGAGAARAAAKPGSNKSVASAGSGRSTYLPASTLQPLAGGPESGAGGGSGLTLDSPSKSQFQQAADSDYLGAEAAAAITASNRLMVEKLESECSAMSARLAESQTQVSEWEVESQIWKLQQRQELTQRSELSAQIDASRVQSHLIQEQGNAQIAGLQEAWRHTEADMQRRMYQEQQAAGTRLAEAQVRATQSEVSQQQEMQQLRSEAHSLMAELERMRTEAAAWASEKAGLIEDLMGFQEAASMDAARVEQQSCELEHLRWRAMEERISTERADAELSTTRALEMQKLVQEAQEIKASEHKEAENWARDRMTLLEEIGNMKEAAVHRSIHISSLEAAVEQARINTDLSAAAATAMDRQTCEQFAAQEAAAAAARGATESARAEAAEATRRAAATEATRRAEVENMQSACRQALEFSHQTASQLDSITVSEQAACEDAARARQDAADLRIQLQNLEQEAAAAAGAAEAAIAAAVASAVASPCPPPAAPKAAVAPHSLKSPGDIYAQPPSEVLPLEEVGAWKPPGSGAPPPPLEVAGAFKQPPPGASIPMSPVDVPHFGHLSPVVVPQDDVSMSSRASVASTSVPSNTALGSGGKLNPGHSSRPDLMQHSTASVGGTSVASGVSRTSRSAKQPADSGASPNASPPLDRKLPRGYQSPAFSCAPVPKPESVGLRQESGGIPPGAAMQHEPAPGPPGPLRQESYGKLPGGAQQQDLAAALPRGSIRQQQASMPAASAHQNASLQHPPKSQHQQEASFHSLGAANPRSSLQGNLQASKLAQQGSAQGQGSQQGSVSASSGGGRPSNPRGRSPPASAGGSSGAGGGELDEKAMMEDLKEEVAALRRLFKEHKGQADVAEIRNKWTEENSMQVALTAAAATAALLDRRSQSPPRRNHSPNSGKFADAAVQAMATIRAAGAQAASPPFAPRPQVAARVPAGQARSAAAPSSPCLAHTVVAPDGVSTSSGGPRTRNPQQVQQQQPHPRSPHTQPRMQQQSPVQQPRPSNQIKRGSLTGHPGIQAADTLEDSTASTVAAGMSPRHQPWQQQAPAPAPVARHSLPQAYGVQPQQRPSGVPGAASPLPGCGPCVPPAHTVMRSVSPAVQFVQRR